MQELGLSIYWSNPWPSRLAKASLGHIAWDKQDSYAWLGLVLWMLFDSVLISVSAVSDSGAWIHCSQTCCKSNYWSRSRPCSCLWSPFWAVHGLLWYSCGSRTRTGKRDSLIRLDLHLLGIYGHIYWCLKSIEGTDRASWENFIHKMILALPHQSIFLLYPFHSVSLYALEMYCFPVTMFVWFNPFSLFQEMMDWYF